MAENLLKDMQQGRCTLQLNSISDVDNDPTLLKLTFSILDFFTSGNRQQISQELALEAAPTLKLKPLVCQYFETTDYENRNDHFGSHGEYETKDRYGNDVIYTNTKAVGVAGEGGFLTTIKNENGEDIEVLACEFYLWRYRYPDIVSLIVEMFESGIPLYSSCEYYFKNYEVKDGVQILKSPVIFDGHCVLKSNENNMGYVQPAYDSSQLLSLNERWEKAISQVIKQDNQNQHTPENKEVDNKTMNQKEETNMEENKLFKALCELSHGDIRTEIMKALSKTMTADEFKWVWVSSYGIYDTYFVYENYENEQYIYYKVPYTKTETEVTVNLAEKVQVKRDEIWVEVSTMESQVNALNETINELKESLNAKDEELTKKDETIQSLNSTIETAKAEKGDVETQFNDASEKLITLTEQVTSLNALVEELKPIKEKFEEEKAEKAFNELKDYYTPKFKALNAMEKFESEDVQNLLKESLNANEDGTKAKLQLNSILVDLVQVNGKDAKPMVKEMASKQENLIPTSVDFDSRYSI